LKGGEKGFKLSTSIHSMSDFEKLSNVFDYAFFGPFSKVFLNQSTFQILILKKIKTKKQQQN
jgi:thiamine-phosphate pyrophosphorylase